MGKVCHSHITYESQERTLGVAEQVRGLSMKSDYLCSSFLRPYQKPGMDACPCNSAVGGWRQANLSSWLVGQPSQNDELLVLWETLSQVKKTDSNRGRTWIHWCPAHLHAANTSVYHTHIQTHMCACTCTEETGHWVYRNTPNYFCGLSTSKTNLLFYIQYKRVRF